MALLNGRDYQVKPVSPEFYKELCDLMFDLKYYFYSIAGRRGDELKDITFHYLMNHFDINKGELKNYAFSIINSLYKTMLSNSTRDVTYIDEVSVSNGIDSSATVTLQRETSEGLTTSFQPMIEKQVLKESMGHLPFISLALTYPEYFDRLCSKLIEHNTCRTYLPDDFKASAKELRNLYGSEKFVHICQELYTVYGESINDYVTSAKVLDKKKWRQLDILILNNGKSVRAGIYKKEENKELCLDPDTEDWELRGVTSGKLCIRVHYAEVFNKLVNLIKEPSMSNVLRLNIGGQYVCRTPAGSYSLPNTPIESEYTKLLDEIVTNLLVTLNGKFLTIGTKCIYFVVSPNEYTEKTELVFESMGLEMKFPIEVVSL